MADPLIVTNEVGIHLDALLLKKFIKIKLTNGVINSISDFDI